MGVISEDILKHFENEPINDDEDMFRLELTAGPYHRALEVLQSWRRRVADGNTLYPVVYENNEVFLNQLVSSLNEADELAWNQGTPCGATIKLYKMTWLLNDTVVAQHNMSQVPYYFFRKLRDLNPALHLNDSQFRAAMAGDPSGPVAVNQSSAR
jgi:xanthine/CO dehydrogenase XdhC/CoxF family maturation factor